MWSYFEAVASFPATIHRARPALGASLLIIATVAWRGGLRRVGFPSWRHRRLIGWLGWIYAGFAYPPAPSDMSAILVEVFKGLGSTASVAGFIHNAG